MRSDNSILKGKWIIRYNQGEFEYPEVLGILLEMYERLDEDQMKAPYKQVVVDKNFKNGFHFKCLDTDTVYCDPTVDIKLNSGDLKNILLAFPVRMSDKRWKTIHFTTASLFLGSALSNAGFNVSTRKLMMPMTAIENSLTAVDMVGFTLFEDLFKETRDFLDQLAKTTYKGLLAAGGPMITLNPLKCAGHLPELNLLVRGEAEFVLPRLLKAINSNNLATLLESKGFLFQTPGTIIISNLNYINRPDDFTGFQFNLDFLEEKHLENGLEINLSRGCSRGCIFCSHVQGRSLRKLPPEIFDQLLSAFKTKVFGSPETFLQLLCKGKRFTPLASSPVDMVSHIPGVSIKRVPAPRGFWPPEAAVSRFLNINDDDILQDIDYAEIIFQLIKKKNFKLWGIQTSVNSFFKADHTVDHKVLDTIGDKTLYVDNNPLTWSGTDVFLKERGKRLGKWIPSEAQMLELMEAFEERDIRNYHYWISSDHRSTWEEFAREFLFIYRVQVDYKRFGLLAHSPFLVPYSTTPLYRLLIKSPELESRIKYRQILNAEREIFRFPLVDRVETAYPHLNRLLNNEKLGNRMGFFDYLKQKDYLNAFITLYDFLKKERLSFGSINSPEIESLKKTEREIETFISTII